MLQPDISKKLERPPWLASRSYPGTSTRSPFSVVYNLRSRRLFKLDGPSSLAWDALLFGQPADASVKEIAARLGQSEGTVAGSLPGFIAHLEDIGLIGKKATAGTPRASAGPVSSEQNSLEDDLESIMVRERILWRLFLEVTYRCNEDCIHCFNPVQRRTNELTTSEIARVFQEARDLGALLLCLTGGEVFSRRDCFELIEAARESEYAVDIYTNGLLANEGRRERLAALYPRSVSVSIYSADHQIHDATTRMKGSLAKSLDTLRHLHELGVPINIKCPLMKHTVDGYRAVKDLADELGATVQFDLVIAAKNDGGLDPVQHRVTDPGTLRMLLLDEDIPLFVGKERIEREAKAANPDGNFCGAGLANLDITPDGTVTPCVSLPLPVGNVRNASIATIWNAIVSPLTAWRNVTISDYVGCRSCDRQAHCTKCAGLALVEHGDFLGPSDQDCAISIARVSLAEEKGLIPLGTMSKIPGNERLDPDRPNETLRRGFTTPLAKLRSDG